MTRKARPLCFLSPAELYLDVGEISRPTPQRLEFNRAGLNWRGGGPSRLEPARLRHRPLRLH
jgi:hypothetical protein